MEILPTIFSAISDLGTIAVLVIGLWLFFTGKIWPEKHVEKLMAEYSAGQEQLCEKIVTKIESAVQNGIVAGIFEARNGKS